MGTPDFILDLRRSIGTAPLWLSGVTAVVLRHGADGPRDVLLVRRSDTGAWTPVTGIIDPGEEPAVAGAREVLEEADVVAASERLALVQSLPPQRYENGDRAQYLDLVFRYRYVSGAPRPADGENTAAEWFPLDALPELSESMRARIAAAAASDDGAAEFRGAQPEREPAGDEPHAAATLDAIRDEIDALDEELVGLLARRQRLVERAGSLKRSGAEVRAPGRAAAVVARARALAEREGASPDVAGRVVQAMVDGFIAHERAHAGLADD